MIDVLIMSKLMKLFWILYDAGFGTLFTIHVISNYHPSDYKNLFMYTIFAVLFIIFFIVQVVYYLVDNDSN